MGKYYYKVVHEGRKTKKLKSLVVIGKPAIVYKQKVWIYPTIKKSKIFVFQTFHAAVNFRGKAAVSFRERENGKIFRCIVKKPRKIRNILPPASSIAEFRDFWKYYAKEKGCLGSYIAPHQTFVVDAVKLLEEIV